MTNEEAYKKLLYERDVIIRIMERDKHRYRDAASLADSITFRNDPPELAQLIKQSALHIFESKLTQRANNLKRAPRKSKIK